MKKAVLLAVVAALVITPAAALANHGHGHGKSAPKVMYVLKGTLSGYLPYNDSIYGPMNGSITIKVAHANHHGRALKGDVLTFPVGPNTRISLGDGVTAIADGDRGIVKIRAAKRIAAADLATTLQATTARRIVDQGASS